MPSLCFLGADGPQEICALELHPGRAVLVLGLKFTLSIILIIKESQGLSDSSAVDPVLAHD